MIAEMTLIPGAVSKVFEDLVSEIVSEGMNFSKKEIKDADQNRKSYNQNLQTQIYYVIIDALNEFTYNKYKKQDKLYDVAENILKGIMSSKNNNTDAIKSGLKILVSGVNDDTCQEFLEILCREICKDENSDLYKEIDMLWKKRESGYIHGEFEKSNQSSKELYKKIDYMVEKERFKEEHRAENYSEISITNRAEEYAQKWNENVFLNNFYKWDENAGINIKLGEIFLEEQLPHYTWKTDNASLDDLMELLREYTVNNDGKNMLLILGQPGIGKSTLITWMMANFIEKNDDFLVYQFASDLKNVYWESDKILDEIFRIFGLRCDELENKVLILDGFDEIYANNNREIILNQLYYELKNMSHLKHFSLVITCRENFIPQLVTIECDYITLQTWNDNQIKGFCEVYGKESKSNISESKINKILENKEVFGVPLILYMVLALNIAIDKDGSIVDVYDQIFSLGNGGIYDRCIINSRYASSHRINKIKQRIHYISQRIAFWIFENNSEKGFIPQREYEMLCYIAETEMERNSEDIQRDVLIGNYFKLTKIFGRGDVGELRFINHSIYEYFVAEYFFESIYKLRSKEEVAEKLGKILKKGRLSKQILKVIKYKFHYVKQYNFSDVILDVFKIMLRDGMMYYTKEKYKNVIEREMNIFANMLELVYLGNSILEGFNDKFILYLFINKKTMLNLEGIELRNANLSGVCLVEAYLSGAKLNVSKLNGADLSGADLKGADLSRADLSGAKLNRADLSGTNLIKTSLRGADLRGANLSEANLILADLRGADLRGADLRGANLDRADLRGALIGEEQTNWISEKCDLSGNKVYLSEAGAL